MPESLEIDAVLLLMEHFYELHQKQIHDTVEKLTGLARSAGIERAPGESMESLISRVRSIARDDFVEEPVTARQGAAPLAVLLDMSKPPEGTGPEKPEPSSNDATGPSAPPPSPNKVLHMATGIVGPTGPMGSFGTMSISASGATGPTGAIGPAGPAGPYGPIGVTGAIGPTGPMGPPIESLHHIQDLPFGGKMECVKEGSKYGIIYVTPRGNRTYWISIFNGKTHEFPVDPTKPWGPKKDLTASLPSTYGGVPVQSEAEMMAVSAIHIHSIDDRMSVGKSGSTPSALWKAHGQDKIWSDFAEDSKKTLVVGGVMTC